MEPQKIIRNCLFCYHYTPQEIGDSELGTTYKEFPSCGKEIDIDPDTEELISDFDRNVERKCCELDFWTVLDHDKALQDKFKEEEEANIKNETGCISYEKTYKLFLSLYNQ